jgi:hypothetical protein
VGLLTRLATTAQYHDLIKAGYITDLLKLIFPFCILFDLLSRLRSHNFIFRKKIALQEIDYESLSDLKYVSFVVMPLLCLCFRVDDYKFIAFQFAQTLALIQGTFDFKYA